jgi:23S rRNA (guanosine2251-2'-O)-methyltransferase
VTNIVTTIEELKGKGFWVAACDMGGQDYYKADLSGKLAVVIGSEGAGISRLVKENCDFTVSMPMVGRITSLNASNAAAVLTYEVRRQRDAKK